MRKKQHEGQGAFDWEPAEETIPEPEARPPQATGPQEWALGTKRGWQLCGKCTLCLEVKREGKWELR